MDSGSLQSSSGGGGGGDDSRSGGGVDSSPLLRQSGSMPGFQELATPPLPQLSSHDQAAPRGSRKRARASRRAPTTVLTTDTSNFRAMVQEFTGIPSPRFAARARFDYLFPSPLRSAASLPPYLARSALAPFASPSNIPNLLSPAPSSALLGGSSSISFDQSPLPPAPATRLPDFLEVQDEFSGLVEGCKATPPLERHRWA